MLSVILTDVEVMQMFWSTIGRWIRRRNMGKSLVEGFRVSFRIPQPVTRPLKPWVISLSEESCCQTTQEVKQTGLTERASVSVLHPGDRLVGQTDGVDLIGESDWFSQFQQGDVMVQVFLPVILWMDDDFTDGHDHLSAALKPGGLLEISQRSCSS